MHKLRFAVIIYNLTCLVRPPMILPLRLNRPWLIAVLHLFLRHHSRLHISNKIMPFTNAKLAKKTKNPAPECDTPVKIQTRIPQSGTGRFSRGTTLVLPPMHRIWSDPVQA